MQKTERTNRNIRMSAVEWDAFKRLLGAEWLRGKIHQAMRREARKCSGKGVARNVGR